MGTMWIAIAVIAVSAIIADAFKRRKDDSELEKDISRLRDDVERLENELRGRVETLERIVTDRHSSLQREFERLDKAS